MNKNTKEQFFLNNRCLSHPTIRNNFFILETKWQFQKSVLLYPKNVFEKIFGKERDIGQP